MPEKNTPVEYGVAAAPMSSQGLAVLCIDQPDKGLCVHSFRTCQSAVHDSQLRKAMLHWLNLEPRPSMLPSGVNGAVASLPKQDSRNENRKMVTDILPAL